MKTLLKNLWFCKNNIFIAWIFFFCVSLSGKSPYSMYKLFLISGTFSIGLVSLIIIYVKYNWYQKS